MGSNRTFRQRLLGSAAIAIAMTGNVFPRLCAVASVAALTGFLNAPQASATTLTLTESSKFLLIGTGSSSTAIAAKTGNYELGANQTTVPASGSPGPDVNDTPLPGTGFKPVPTGVQNNGEIAVTDPAGQFDFSKLGLYANTGVQCAGTAAGCAKGTSDSAFNQPNYPNASNGTPTSFDPNKQLGGAGGGVTGGVDFSLLNAELAASALAITAFAPTGTVDFGSGTRNSDFTTTLVSGFNVIDLVNTGGGDFVLQNANWIIDGPADAFGIFRVPDDKKFLISHANILAGSGLGGLDRLLFFSSNNESDGKQIFNFNNTIINGVAFWALLNEININNGQGCTQLVSPKINLNDVRLSRCSASTFSDTPPEGPSPGEVPLPAAVVLMGTVLAGGFGVGAWRRRREQPAA